MTRHEEEIEPGLKYTEETGRIDRSLPVRDCFLWKAGVDEPISGLNLFSFQQRFGAVSVPTEGLGGVETVPRFRRQGLMSQLMWKALEGIPERVKILFASDAAADLYEKFGFVTCVAEAYLSVHVRNVERMAGRVDPGNNGRVHGYSTEDLPASALSQMVKLYNHEHMQRPFTHERPAEWKRLLVGETWQPGSEVIVLEGEDGLDAYAILTERYFGQVAAPFVVDELTAKNVEAARALLVELASRCWQMRISEFRVYEPLDSTVGKAARALGCDYHQVFAASGGMMGVILDRPGLLLAIEPELRRRLPADGLSEAHTTAFDALCQGDLLPDNRNLLRLLVGYWSLDDAVSLGTDIPAANRPVCEAWFPGGGTEAVPMPYSHKMDRY